jgi:hypothetical protein
MKPVALLFLVLLLFGCARLFADELRTQRYVPGTSDAAHAWQDTLRMELLVLLALDRVASAERPPLEASLEWAREEKAIHIAEYTIAVTPARRVPVRVVRPLNSEGRLPAVVCIHGHGGTRETPYNPVEPIYKEFGTALATAGFVTIAVDVGQHDVQQEGWTLMGKRLWDLIRCVDYLQTREDVDPQRIGCAGLSLGGEMAMWLGAMDPRIQATVSAGFLTRMDQMEQNHCLCWKFAGLRERADFADIYALIAPRALQCQNGAMEPPTQFTPALALEAMAEVWPVYRDLGAPDNAELLIHGGAHEIALGPMVDFLKRHLRRDMDSGS